MTGRDALAGFYAPGAEGEEDLRLRPGSAHYLEFTTAMRILSRYLPESRAVENRVTVLDSCAGTGAYAFALADAGFAVTAGDIVPHNVEVMRGKQGGHAALVEIYCGDALELSRFADESFGAVLLMGALYHLSERAERELAVRENMRVLKPGGIFAATYMNRYAVILNNCAGSLDNLDEIIDFAKNGREGIFYASAPGEAEDLMKKSGLDMLCHAALDGIANFLGGAANLLNGEGVARWGEFHALTCEEPSLLGYGYHNIIIGKKRK